MRIKDVLSQTTDEPASDVAYQARRKAMRVQGLLPEDLRLSLGLQ